jgi:hypothetical protein
MQGMDALNPALCAVNVHTAMLEINLRPPKLRKLNRPQPMPVRQQDRSSVSLPIPATLARCAYQSFDFCFG